MARRAGWAVAALASALALGCGADEPAPRAGHPPADGATTRGGGQHAQNAPPLVERVTLEPDRPHAGQPVRAVVSASDRDGDTIRFRYVWRINGQPLTADGERIDLRETVKGDEVEVEVIPNDGRSEGTPYSATTRVANRPPRILGLALESPSDAEPGRDLVASPRSDDPDGDELEFRYAWLLNGEALDASGASLSTRGLRRGDRVEVVAVASDGEDESEPHTSPQVAIGNSPPEIVSEAGWEEVDGVFHHRVEARDPDGDRTLRYRLLKAPGAMKIDPLLGEITWKPGREDAGTHPVEVEVDDLRGGRSVQTFELTIHVEEPEAADGAAKPAPGGADLPAAPGDLSRGDRTP